jgi:polyisoprenoid-binding protein YceI
MIFFRILILFLCFTSLQTSFAQTWKPVSTSFSFTTKMLGIKVEGKFKGFQGNIIFNPADLENASISGTVEASTIDTDNNLRNTHLKEKNEFFEVVKFPKIKMSSTKIEKSGNGYVGTFNLTIKTVTKSLKIPFTADISNEKLVMKGTTTLNRKDWKIGGNTMGMSSDVTINLNINASK